MKILITVLLLLIATPAFADKSFPDDVASDSVSLITNKISECKNIIKQLQDSIDIYNQGIGNLQIQLDAKKAEIARYEASMGKLGNVPQAADYCKDHSCGS